LIEFLFGNQLPLIDSDLSPQTSHPAVWPSFILMLIKPGPSELKTATDLKIIEKLVASWLWVSTTQLVFAHSTWPYIITALEEKLPKFVSGDCSNVKSTGSCHCEAIYIS
jgi:hypothetical protein